MKKFGLVGKGIQNSFSPEIHNYCFKVLSLDAVYDIIDIASESQIKEIIENLKSGNLNGVNVTTPYKQSFDSYLDTINPRAELIGSINCIYRNNSQLIGNNTDWYGFFKSLENINGYNDVVILGTGGVTLSLLFYFKKNQDYKIHIIGRNQNKLKNFQSDQFLIYDIENFNLKIDNGFIINAISSSANFDWDLVLKKINGNIKYAMDLNYHLKVTEFLNSFDSNVKIKNGLDMLIYQALMSIDIWYKNDLTLSIDVDKLKNKLIEKYYNE